MTSNRTKSMAILLGVGLAVSGQIASAQSAAPQSNAGQSTDQATEGAESLDTVTVSASRIRAEGYDAPTPVAVIGTEAIQREARIDVADMIRDLPSFGASSSPNNSQNQSLVTSGVAGLNLVSLRNLGFLRNLVLFDGQRVVTSSVNGGVDMSTIPTSLVERIEVVTGGASASWGSDAITGVVNVLINKEFDGLEANIALSDNWASNHASRKVDLSWGTGFADDRGRLILSASATETPDEFYSYDIPNFKYQRVVDNELRTATNGLPLYRRADNVGLWRATPGGVIIGNTGAAAVLNNIYFPDKAATPTPYNPGVVSRQFYSHNGTLNTSESDIGLVSAPSDGSNFFGLVSYELTDNLKASLQLNYGRFWSFTNSWSYIRYGNLSIKADNPFIPASIQQVMAQNNISSFLMGTLNHIPGRPSLDQQVDSLGYTPVEQTRTLTRGVFTLDGKINDDWSWEFYFQQGESDLFLNSRNGQQPAKYNLAVDAVRVTAANVGTSGLPIGSIACRSTLTDPTNGCKPLNVFGIGNASAEAINYVTSVSRNGGQTMKGLMTQKVASLSFQGTLPVGFEAGNIVTAFGIESREEEGRQVASAAAQATTFQLGNPKNFYGKYDTKEAFAEFSVPLLKDGAVDSLNFDAAARYTDYSTSGQTETFKVGLASQMNSDLKIRLSYSSDLRAPTLFDIFNTGVPVTGTAQDPKTGQTVSVFSTTRGNPTLKPEESVTKALGVVYTPSWLPGMSLSIDYYDIQIDGAIASYNTTITTDQCKAGNQVFCSNLVFGGPNGELTTVFSQPINADFLSTSGIDVSADYRAFVGPGALNVSLQGNYQIEQQIESLGKPTDYIGSISDSAPYRGAPRINGQLSITYVLNDWTASVQGRYVGSAWLNTSWTAADISRAENYVAARSYLDLRASYQVNDSLRLYVALDNVLDQNAPVVPMYTGGSAFETPFLDAYHDIFGRVWRFSARMKF